MSGVRGGDGRAAPANATILSGPRAWPNAEMQDVPSSLEPAGTSVASSLARLHQLDAIFMIFGASDRDKRLILQGRGLRKPL
jgi:hypothetical protein